MPQLGELPEGLKRLADRNASIIHPRRFRADLKKLVGDVERALKNAPVKWLERARHYLGAKDYAKALPLLQKAAEAGNVEAMRNLGSLYANGWGVTMDWAESHRWYQKAAEAGDIDGMRSLDAMFYHGLGRASNYAQALEWFQKAANDEDMQSMYNLGVLYEHGRGVTQDHAQARYWFQKAAQAGYPLAPGALWRLRSK
jgi:TPR repeat protein